MLLESLKRTLIVQTFRSLEALDTEYMVIEVLQTDGTTANVRAYGGLQGEFRTTTQWPTSGVSGKIDILIGMEELSLHPREI